ncbi:TetR/AcrR family transcriptional regulator [Actinokineospora spheciospongiae]|uniref:TetR/AcrR family transcriptional regulator n=1 Tax=Actinokineospora spheciospongiae TaxID=909613 RepID=UPI000D70E5BB|nr:TetR/AcrR family transcriptional regulator [Actinokineospora spheciospongiae]PWW54137.1 TetR family transcriptional regulator [Actinokineospora spheciospongiae]
MSAQPRRADARRNLDRVVRAGIAAFEDLGDTPSLEEVARRAGVGIATVYRLVGGREGLVRAAFEAFFAEEIEPLALTARTAADPWRALTHALAATVERMAAHRVLLAAAHRSGAVSVDTAERYLGPLAHALAAAQHAGQARPDLLVRDLAAIVVMALATTHPGDPDGLDRRRYLALLLDGARPGTRPPQPLPPPAPRPAPARAAAQADQHHSKEV